MPAKPRVIFVYSPAHSGAGSKIMRVDQLAQAATELTGAKWDIGTLELPRFNRPRRLHQCAAHMQDAVVIFLKGAFARADERLQQRWASAARAVAIDYVDSNIDQNIQAPVSMHVSASRAGARALRRHLGPTASIELVDHHWDPRVTRSLRSAEAFSVGYFGDPANTVIPERTAARLATSQTDPATYAADMFAAMADTALHYGVRELPPEQGRTVFKPFTKGFNAAAADANILVNRQVDDAVDFLGQDYPFLIDGTDETSVHDGLLAAQSSFATSEWKVALDRMRAIRDQTSLASCVQQLDQVLSALMDL